MKRQGLVTKLEMVGRALAQSDLIQILKCFTFHDGYVSAFDDKLAIVSECEVKESFAVNGKTLLGLLQNCSSEEVSIKIGDGNDVVVIAGKGEFKLPFFTKDEFVFEEPDGKWDHQIEIDTELLAGLQACLTTVSADEATQAALCGIVVHDNYFYSSDGDSITKYRIGTEYSGPQYLVPTSFWEAILSTKEHSGNIEFIPGWACAVVGSNVIFAQTVKSTFNHEDTIKKTLKKAPKYSPIPDGLDEAISRARVIADQESAKTLLIVKENQLHLYTESSLGTVTDVLPFEHPDVSANVSAELIQRSLTLNTEIAIMENCICFRNEDWLFQIVSNL